MLARNVVLGLAVVWLVACGPEAADDPTVEPTGSAVPGGLPPGAVAQIHGPWADQPFALPAQLVARMDAACRESMAPFPQGVILVVVDARGEGVAQMYYAGENSAASCNDVAVERDGTVAVWGGGGTAVDMPAREELEAFELVVTDESTAGRRPEVTATYLAGRAGPGIAAVRATIGNGRIARATLRDGWWAIWFPAEVGTTWTLQGLDGLGNVVARP